MTWNLFILFRPTPTQNPKDRFNRETQQADACLLPTFAN